MTDYSKILANIESRKDAEDRAAERDALFRADVRGFFNSVQIHLKLEIYKANRELQKVGAPEVVLEDDPHGSSQSMRFAIRLGRIGERRVDIGLECFDKEVGIYPEIDLQLVLEPGPNGDTRAQNVSFDMVQADNQIFARRPDRWQSWPYHFSAQRIAAVAVCALLCSDIEQGVNESSLAEANP